MNEDKIWNRLMDGIGNPFGAAGLMGNLYAESALNPRNLQQSFEKKLGYTDDTYTVAVDAGSYTNFVHDGAGYGLAQWTYWSRKVKLLTFACLKDVSIGDLEMQLEFLLDEIRGYSTVWAALTGAKSVRAASDAVLTGYERPKDQSESVKVKRAAYGQRFFDTYAKKESGSMTVKVGSARIDENGRATGGKAGDQTGREVSTQSWYKHSKGWRVFRAKDPAVAEKIAWNMQAACDNAHIGYDQGQRSTLYNVSKPLGFNCKAVTTNCETDCSALVRVCCAYAGVMLPNIRTTNEPSALLASGAFIELTGAKYTDQSDYLRRGDILCTRTQGHTVVVLSDGGKAETVVAPVEGLRRGDYGTAVTAMQRALLVWNPDCLPKYGADGDFGGETEAAVKAYQKEAGLPVSGVYDEATRKALTDIPAPPAAPAGDDPSEAPEWVLASGGDVNVRAEPGTDAPIIGVLHRMDCVPYQGETRQWGGRDWYKILLDDETGWVSSKFTEVTVG